MEPVSLAASIVTLISTASATSVALTRLWSLRKHPEHLRAAINEITDFQSTLHLIHNTLASPGVNLDADIQTRIESLLASAKAPIDAYRTFLDKVLVNPDIDKDSLKFKPAGKLREILGDNHRKLETLQRELASIKGSLSAALSLANLRYAPKLLMTIQQVSLVHQHNYSTSTTWNHDHKTAATIENAANDDNSPSNASHDFRSCPPTLSSMSLTSETITRQRDQSPASWSNSFVAITTKAIRRACPKRCLCQCHIPLQGRTPRWLRDVLGSMYIASAGIPLLNYRTCNEPTCHKSGNRAGSFHLKYLFPAWLFSVGLEIAGTWSGINGTGATLTFSIPRVISNYHYWDIANMIDDWSIDDFERYMYSNQISPNDVWEGGLTIFEAVVDYHRHDIGFMLLDRGVNLHSLSHTACTLGQFFLTKFLGFPSFGFSEQQFLQSDQITEVIDGSNFSILHEIILGINEKSLAAEIDRAPTCVHDVDCFGLTPLHWASIVGNIDAIDTLLEAGADINATCKTGRSAIYWASRCNRFKCCENLLAGGADISIRDCDGESALLRLLHGNSTSKNLVTLFIQHGADVNCQTFDNGVSCLMAACINTSVDVCSALIEHGANIETVGHNGETAIVCAISYNRVSTVKLLCEKGAILTRIDDFGESIIHGVARFGGVDIMQILSEAKFEGLRMEHEDFQSYWRIFDYDRDDWFEGERAPIEVERAAFKALLDSIIPATIVESHTELDKINLPGAFPIDEDSMRQDESSSDEDEGDQADFHNAVELQEDIE